MSDASSLAKSADDLCKRIELGAADDKTRRSLFGELAKLRNSAEAANATETIEKLDKQRTPEKPAVSKLRIPRKALSPAGKASMYLRFGLTAWVALWGAVCVLMLIPLRFLHPVLRQVGVPNGRLPFDVLIEHWARAVLAAAGVKVTIERGSVDWASQAELVGIIVYNHASNLDPFIVNGTCCSAPKYIGKKVLFMLPIVGWLFLCCGMVPLNRGDREKAVHTMNEAVANIMKRWRRSVAISPEGTRTTDGHLRLPFKKGVFHLQDKTKVPLLPIVILGANQLWPPGQLFTSPGEVTVSYLPPLYQEKASDEMKATDATRLRLQREYADFIADNSQKMAARTLSWMDAAVCVCRLLITLVVYGFLWRLLPSLGGKMWAAVFLGLTVADAGFVQMFL